jgi:hypothetical protein
MPSDMRFTQAQRRDLLRMSGAAVVSTIFFGVPMFVGRPDASRVQTVAIQEQQAPPVTAAPSQPLTMEPAVVVVVSDAVAPITTPMLQTPRSIAPRPRATAPRQMLASDSLQRERPRATPSSSKPLAKRLGRLLAGTGRYEVKPFPTVSTSGS